jgi:hypothetical protein
VKSWCIPKPSSRFVAQMEDVLAVYQRPYDPRYPQVCLDESQKGLRATPRGDLALEPGQFRREDYTSGMERAASSLPLSRCAGFVRSGFVSGAPKSIVPMCCVTWWM